MEHTPTKVMQRVLPALLTTFLMSQAVAEETVIQQEKISFEKCLKVIVTSENKLAIAPESNSISDQRRIAVFTLVDGTLTITCDAKEGKVTVSTNTN